MFYAQPSAYIWHDNTGAAHTILQAEGGEQGDPLMPALFSLGQRAALQRVQQELQEGELLFAFLDDVYVLSQPARIRPIYDLLAHHLHAHARIRLNSGKTRIWNGAGSEPPNIQDLGPDVWVGNPGLPRNSQGLVALGAPVGTQEYKQQHLQQTLTQHTELLQAIPTLDDLQASWLLLLFCASPRCNYHLRMLAPEETATFAQDHDTAVAACFTQLLDTGPIPPTSLAIAHLPLHMGGLGLSSASVLATPAYWASWADTLPVLAQQAPQLTRSFLLQLQQPSSATPSLHSAIQTAQRLEQHGWQPPTWNAIVEGEPPPTHPTSHLEGPTFQKGWQRRATQACHTAFHNEVDNTLDPPARAMLASQSGPYASRAFTTIPYGPDTSYPPHLFRVILLRRLRLPLPLTSRTCRCRRILDPLGDHRAACAQSGVLRSRGGPLERATARICREAGARVTTNTSQWPQHQPPPPTRWPPDRSHCQWPPALEWSPAGRGHRPCLTPHSRWPAQTPSRKVRRSRPTRCPQKQRTNLPRPPQQPTLPFGRACNRGGGQMEWGGRRLHQQPGTSPSQTSTHHPPTKRCGRSHRTMVRHVDPCSHDPLRSHSSWRNYTQSLQRRHQSRQLEPTLGGSPAGPSFLQSPPPPCLSIPGPWTFALRASRVPGDCPVKQSKPQTDQDRFKVFGAASC